MKPEKTENIAHVVETVLVAVIGIVFKKIGDALNKKKK